MVEHHRTVIGSSKSVSRHALGSVILDDLGTGSIFDLPLPNFKHARLARARRDQAVAIFRYLHHRGIDTHFIEPIGDTGIVVRECSINDRTPLSGLTFGRHCNIELLFRSGVSDKTFGRIESGALPREKFILNPGDTLKPGVELAMPFVEASTKWETRDRYLTDEEVMQVAEVGPITFHDIMDLGRTVSVAIDALFSPYGFQNDDGKIEAAIDHTTDKPIMIDVSSLDELGLRWGNDHYGKNLFRHWYRDNYPEWYKALKKAQDDHPGDRSMWPTYPCPLPDEVVETYITRYESVAGILIKHIQTLKVA